jgi:hypothetical protein
MAQPRIRLDSRADHNALMAHLCRCAAAGLALQIDLTKDPKEREALRRRVQEHQAQSEMHRRIVEELELGDVAEGCS